MTTKIYIIMHVQTEIMKIRDGLLVEFNSVVSVSYVPHIPQTSDSDASLYQ